ncbi:hypothetical protein BVRB_020920 [Beta vulgaris subsp. vulgaris]|uniref:Uncharacterized protein n=1 Tax=Beta vulgaris subsp. vulgaris TaxID=3555 RepID=A0A0J8B3R6_BETVV|nr:hypothetical protein BVRB_020920 [Beta vulgaris subsp. vulgaris]
MNIALSLHVHCSDSPPDVKPPPKKAKKPTEPCVKVRHSTTPFQAFIAAIADQPEKKQAIIDMGFGGLLELDMPRNDPIFCARLVSRFCVGSGSLLLRRGKDIDIREIDVHLVYGIPLGGLVVDETKELQENDADFRSMIED